MIIDYASSKEKADFRDKLRELGREVLAASGLWAQMNPIVAYATIGVMTIMVKRGETNGQGLFKSYGRDGKGKKC